MKKRVKIEGHYEKNIQKSKSTMQNQVNFSWERYAKPDISKRGYEKISYSSKTQCAPKKSACWNVDNL